jgi:hypothetical protein
MLPEAVEQAARLFLAESNDVNPRLLRLLLDPDFHWLDSKRSIKQGTGEPPILRKNSKELLWPRPIVVVTVL